MFGHQGELPLLGVGDSEPSQDGPHQEPFAVGGHDTSDARVVHRVVAGVFVENLKETCKDEKDFRLPAMLSSPVFPYTVRFIPFSIA